MDKVSEPVVEQKVETEAKITKREDYKEKVLTERQKYEKEVWDVMDKAEKLTEYDDNPNYSYEKQLEDPNSEESIMKDRFDKQHVKDLEDEKKIWDYYAKKGLENAPYEWDGKVWDGKVEKVSMNWDDFDDFHYEF